MKTARYYGIRDIRFEELDKPVCGPGQALIRVAYAGICGSDLHIYNKGMFIQNIPETMGHEFAGVIEEVGPEVTGFRPGDKVIADPMVPCMECESCWEGSYNTCAGLGFIGEVRQGCYAEYIAMDQDKLIRVPADADLRQIALAEPLAVVLNLLEKADPKPADTMAVIGCGPIGLLTIQAAKALYGVNDIAAVNRSPERLKLATAAGASETFSELPADRTFSRVVEAAGNQASFRTALEHTAANGAIYAVSIFEDNFEVDINAIVAGQISLVGCNVYEKRHLEQAVAVLADGRIDGAGLITGEFDLTQCAEAFEAVNSRRAGKVLFRMGGQFE